MAIIIVITCTACEKDKDQDQQDDNKVNASTLMGSNGRRWRLADITLTYYNTGGGIDSTVKLQSNSANFQYQTLYFMNDGSKQIFMSENLFTRVIPAYGSWQINYAEQKITFACIENRFFPCNNTDGEWKIIRYSVITVNPASEFVDFERTVTLSGGRKVKQFMSIMIV